MKLSSGLKKIRNIAMVAIIGFQSLFSAIPAHALSANDVSYDHNNVRNMEVTFSGETKTIVMAPIYLDGNLVFCVDPFTLVIEGSGYSSNPFVLNRKANLVSTFWRYAGTDWDTYFVAQEMMYEAVGATPHSNGNLTLAQRQTIKDRINQVITNYEKKPSFHNKTIKVTLGDSITLTDTNGVDLSKFDSLEENTANIDFSINGNSLVITPRKDSNTTGKLVVEKSLERGTPYLWKKAGSQELVSAGVADPADFVLNLEIVKTGEVKIVKLDKGTGEVVANTEFKVEYDGKSQTVKTNDKGEAIVKNILHDTKVKVTETFVPAPYILDTNNTKEVVIQAGKTASVEFKNERATGKTTLTKQDATTESNEPLNPAYPMTGAKYGLFKEDGTLLKEFTLNEKLTASMDKLELGNYYWQETVAPVGYTLDQTKHVVELTYKDQYTPVVVKDAGSNDDVIRMNVDGQKLIQNETNEMFKNDVEFTLTNKRTGETHVVTTATVDGKKGYFRFADIALDDYVLTETKGVEGYKNVDPIEITHSYDKETDTFTFVVKDQKSGNVLNEEKITQLELSKGENVDLGTYTLKDKATPNEEPVVGISTQAHTGDGKTQTFVWGEDVKFYDDVKIMHKNIEEGTERAYETIQVAVYPDGKEKDVWTSGKVDYTVTDKEMTERVLSEYDYKKDPEGTRYYFKEIGYNKPTEKEYVKDTEHNFDGKEKTQDITPVVKEISKETPKPTEKEDLPYTGEDVKRMISVVGLALVSGVAGAMYLRHKKSKETEATQEDK